MCGAPYLTNHHRWRVSNLKGRMKRYRRNSLNRLEKYCIKCGEWKDLENDFYNHKGTLDKRQSYCKNGVITILYKTAKYGNRTTDAV
jgi:hypothetical protein